MKFNVVAVAFWILILAAVGWMVYEGNRPVPTKSTPVVTAPVTPPVVASPPAVTPVPGTEAKPKAEPAPAATHPTHEKRAPPVKKVVHRNQDPKCRDVPTEAYRHPADVVIAAARRLDVSSERMDRLRWCIDAR